jgi:hypothetical protein
MKPLNSKNRIMETNEIKTLEDLKNFNAWHFKRLKPAKTKQDTQILEINVSGYTAMLSLATNLIKMSILAIDADEPPITSLVVNPFIDVASVLELALQLIPHGEVEVLDELHQIFSNDSQDLNKRTTEKE